MRVSLDVGKKMMIGGAAMLFAVLMLAFVTGWALTSVDAQLEQSTGPIARQLELAGNLEAGANLMRTGQRGILLNALQHDPAGIESTRKDYETRYQSELALLGEL